MSQDGRIAEGEYSEAFEALGLGGTETRDQIREAYEALLAAASEGDADRVRAAHERLAHPERAHEELFRGMPRVGVPIPAVADPGAASSRTLALEVMRALVGRSSPLPTEPSGGG